MTAETFTKYIFNICPDLKYAFGGQNIIDTLKTMCHK